MCGCGFLFAGSGKFERSTDGTFEAAMYARLSEKLRQRGAICIIPEFVARDTNVTPAHEDHILSRVSILKSADEQLTRQVGPEQPKMWIGFSLGAHCLLRLVSSEMRPPLHLSHLLLAGCVLEQPVTILAPLRTVKLLYGEMDYIAYCGDDGNMTRAISPRDYAVTTCSRLVMRKSQARAVNIWSGCDHLLSDRKPNAASRTADRLFDIIADIMKGVKN